MQWQALGITKPSAALQIKLRAGRTLTPRLDHLLHPLGHGLPVTSHLDYLPSSDCSNTR